MSLQPVVHIMAILAAASKTESTKSKMPCLVRLVDESRQACDVRSGLPGGRRHPRNFPQACVKFRDHLLANRAVFFRRQERA